MYRIEQITRDRFKSRRIESQSVEAHIKYLVINKITRLGIPIGTGEAIA